MKYTLTCLRLEHEVHLCSILEGKVIIEVTEYLNELKRWIRARRKDISSNVDQQSEPKELISVSKKIWAMPNPYCCSCLDLYSYIGCCFPRCCILVKEHFERWTVLMCIILNILSDALNFNKQDCHIVKINHIIIIFKIVYRWNVK